MWLLAQLAGLFVIVTLLIPDVRQTVFSIGIIAVVFLGMVVLCVVIFALDRAASQQQNLKAMTGNAFVPSVGAPAQKSNGDKPEAETFPQTEEFNR